MDTINETADRAAKSAAGGEIPTGALEVRSYWQNVFLRLRRDPVTVARLPFEQNSCVGATWSPSGETIVFGSGLHDSLHVDFVCLSPVKQSTGGMRYG